MLVSGGVRWTFMQVLLIVVAVSNGWHRRVIDVIVGVEAISSHGRVIVEFRPWLVDRKWLYFDHLWRTVKRGALIIKTIFKFRC